jgi:hypothetical protein
MRGSAGCTCFSSADGKPVYGREGFVPVENMMLAVLKQPGTWPG